MRTLRHVAAGPLECHARDMSNRTISLLAALTLLTGLASGWMVQRAAMAEEGTDTGEVFPTSLVDSLTEEESDPADDALRDALEPDESGEEIEGDLSREDGDEENGDDDTKVDALEDEEPEEIVVRLEGGEEDRDEDEDRVDRERLEEAEQRIEELEERLATIEGQMERTSAWQDEVDDSLANLEEIGEAVVEAEERRHEIAAARAAREESLRGVEQELASIEEKLARGSDAAARPIRALERTLGALASEASDYGHIAEAEKLEAAVHALGLSRSALERRDLHETRTGVGLALAQVRAARALTRMELEP